MYIWFVLNPPHRLAWDSSFSVTLCWGHLVTLLEGLTVVTPMVTGYYSEKTE